MPQHRAAGPAPARRSPGDPAGPAHRRATAPRPLSGLLSAPVVVGALALSLATAGVVTGAEKSGAVPLHDGSLTRTTGASAAAATPVSAREIRAAWAGRERALSRDAHRDAVRPAHNARLQAVAETQARKRMATLAAQAAGAEKQARRLAARSWQLPVSRGAYHLTAGFGQCSGLWSNCHTGLDFAAPEGTAIHAVAGGRVTEVGWAGAYGNRTVETLEDGTQLWYCHQSATAVSVGEKVAGGQVIGAVGSTGNTTGPHVHLEVRPHPDHPVDPKSALVAHGVTP